MNGIVDRDYTLGRLLLTQRGSHNQDHFDLLHRDSHEAEFALLSSVLIACAHGDPYSVHRRIQRVSFGVSAYGC